MREIEESEEIATGGRWSSILGSFAKSGPWAILALLLVWFLLVQRDTKSDNIQAAVTANGLAMQSISGKMDKAAENMRAYVIAAEEKQERAMLLLLEVCVQQAQATRVAGTTERCFSAARGQVVR